jgi:hypothetical protein
VEHVQLPVTKRSTGRRPHTHPSRKRADARTPAGVVPPEIRSSALGEVLLFQGQCGPYSAPHRAQPISAGRRLLNLAFFSLKTSEDYQGPPKEEEEEEAQGQERGRR